MDAYHSDLTVLKLNEASKALTEALQHGKDAHMSGWMVSNIKRMISGINNRVFDILDFRESK